MSISGWDKTRRASLASRHHGDVTDSEWNCALSLAFLRRMTSGVNSSRLQPFADVSLMPVISVADMEEAHESRPVRIGRK